MLKNILTIFINIFNASSNAIKDIRERLLIISIEGIEKTASNTGYMVRGGSNNRLPTFGGHDGEGATFIIWTGFAADPPFALHYLNAMGEA